MMDSKNVWRHSRLVACAILAAILGACSGQGGAVSPTALPPMPLAPQDVAEPGAALDDLTTTTAPIAYIDDTNGVLYTVNLATYALHRVGSQGVVLTDLAFDPINHVLYGISYSDFYRVNTTTGLATHIGALGLYDANALVFDAHGRGYTEGFADPELYAINNVSTGRASPIGRTGSWESAGDLTFYNNTLILAGNDGAATDAIVTLNHTTGAVISVAQTNLTNLYGLVSPSANHLYGFSNLSMYRIVPSAPTVAQRAVLLRNFDRTGIGQILGAAYNGNFQL